MPGFCCISPIHNSFSSSTHVVPVIQEKDIKDKRYNKNNNSKTLSVLPFICYFKSYPYLCFAFLSAMVVSNHIARCCCRSIWLCQFSISSQIIRGLMPVCFFSYQHIKIQCAWAIWFIRETETQGEANQTLDEPTRYKDNIYISYQPKRACLYLWLSQWYKCADGRDCWSPNQILPVTLQMPAFWQNMIINGPVIIPAI